MSYVICLSWPERTRARAGLALEDAHLSILPPDHHAIGQGGLARYTRRCSSAWVSQRPT